MALLRVLSFSSRAQVPAPPAPYRNLVLEGGGIRGIAYGGALLELEQRDVLAGLRRVGGTSAGAIQAALLANYPVDLFDYPRYLPAGAPAAPDAHGRALNPKRWACASTAPSRFRSTARPPAASSSPPTPSPISTPTWAHAIPWPSKTSTPCSPVTGSALSASNF